MLVGKERKNASTPYQIKNRKHKKLCICWFTYIGCERVISKIVTVNGCVTAFVENVFGEMKMAEIHI